MALTEVKNMRAKFLAVLMSVVLAAGIAIPSTLAVESATDGTDSTAFAQVEDANAEGIEAEGVASEDIAAGIIDGEEPAEEAADEMPIDAFESDAQTVNFTNVAPFEDPIIGKAPAAMMERIAPLAEEGAEEDNGMKISKTAKANEDGTYTISLEAYATGSKIITEVTEDVPTDIVLVLDQSGSMAEGMGSVRDYKAYENRSNSYLRDRRFGGGRADLYYPIDDGRYVQVRVERSGNNGDRRQYIYYYMDGQNRVNIETSFGDNTVPTKIYYQYAVISNASRLEALESAVTTFSNSIAAKAAGADGNLSTTEDNVNHRVAVVGFASKDGYGDNTELLSIAGTNSGSVGVEYDSIEGQDLISVLQDMDTSAGQAMVTNAINALDAEGATQADLGMDMANRILNANPVSADEKRARVVVFFTDGSPTSFNGFEDAVANAAIANAKTIKDGGATVYSVGVFPGADATGNGIAQGNNSRRENRFMQDVSSNNGIPQDPSYYLSAADAESLNNIFQQISDEIESGGSTTKLDASAVVKDIIAPAFQLPKDATAANITLETYACTGKDAVTGEYTWAKNADAMGAKATVDGDNVDVTGFDFAKNYVGPEIENGIETGEYQGHKLAITFTVEAKPGFLGGNNVYTNTNAGVYENADATDPVFEFERPQVNVPIKDLEVSAEDKNVYLLGGLTAEQILAGAKVTVDGTEFDLSQPNFGFADWQMEYVNITVTDENDKQFDFQDLTADQTYNLKVTVSPKTKGENASGKVATEKSATATANINVFKPEVTYKDSSINYGETPKYEGQNFVSTAWKHGEIVDSAAPMTGEAPELAFDYDHIPAVFEKDTEIKVTRVSIGDVNVLEHASFVREACDVCGFTGGAVAKDGVNFIVHLKRADLVITKTVSGSTAIDPDQSFVFKVTGPDNKTLNVVLTGADFKDGSASATVKDVLVGKQYTVTEDTAWSWRYKLTSDNDVVVTAETGTNSVTFANELVNNKWLSGDSSCQNIFKDAIEQIKSNVGLSE